MKPLILIALGRPRTPGSVDIRVATTSGNSSSCTATWWSDTDHLYILDAEEHVWTFHRFQNVTIPKGATITAAHIEVTPRWFSSTPAGPDSILIGVEQVDNAGATSGYADIKARFAALPDTVEWSAASWAVNTPASSPSLAAQVQELVNRSGWASGNSLVVVTRTKAGFTTVGGQAWSGPSSPGDLTRVPRLIADYLA